MEIALPGSEVLFSHMQEALRHVKFKRVTLTKGVHQALADLRRLVQDLQQRPTWLYELVLLYLTLEGYHDAYGYICGGTVLSGPTSVPRTLQPRPRAAKTTPDPMGAHRIFRGRYFPSTCLRQWILGKT